MPATQKKQSEYVLRDPRCIGHFELAADAGSGVNEIAGVPVTRYWKDLMRVGDFYKSRTGQNINVTQDRLEHWKTDGNDFIASGNRVPVNLDHSPTADAGVGKVLAFDVVGDRLRGLLELVGSEAPTMLMSNDVSVGGGGDWTDTDGKTWRDILDHVAITQKPVVTQLRPATIAASQFTFSQEPPMADDMVNYPASTDCHEMMCSQLPALRKLPEAQRMSHIAGHMAALHAVMPGAGRFHMSHDAGLIQPLSEREAGLLTREVTTQLDAVATKRGWTPAYKAKWAAELTQSGGKPNIFMLSNLENPSEAGQAARILALIDGEEKVNTQEQTGAQGEQFTMSRIDPKGADSNDVSKWTPERIKAEVTDKMNVRFGPRPVAAAAK